MRRKQQGAHKGNMSCGWSSVQIPHGASRFPRCLRGSCGVAELSLCFSLQWWGPNGAFGGLGVVGTIPSYRKLFSHPASQHQMTFLNETTSVNLNVERFLLLGQHWDNFASLLRNPGLLLRAAGGGLVPLRQTTGKLLGFAGCVAELLAEPEFWLVLRCLGCRRQRRASS